MRSRIHHDFARIIQIPVKHLRWSFVPKELTTERDEMCNRVLNTFLGFAIKTLLTFREKLFSKSKDNENFPKHKKNIYSKTKRISEQRMDFIIILICFATLK